MPIQLQLLVFCTFLNISPTFAIPLILSFLLLSSLVTPLIHFGHILCLLHCPWLGSVHYCWFDNRFVHFPLDPQAIRRSHRTPDSLFQFFPYGLFSMRHLAPRGYIFCPAGQHTILMTKRYGLMDDLWCSPTA